MRTIVDIPDDQIKILNQMVQRKKVSRAEVIRQALASYIASDARAKKGYKSAFGIWKKLKLDSVQYQQKLRSEWGE